MFIAKLLSSMCLFIAVVFQNNNEIHRRKAAIGHIGARTQILCDEIEDFNGQPV